MQHRSLANDPPVVGDVVVVDGTKYRIRAVGQSAALALAGPAWQRAGTLRTVAPESLYWDPLAGVWRVG